MTDLIKLLQKSIQTIISPRTVLLLSALVLTGPVFGQDKKLTISGFSEVRFESRFGDPANQKQADSVFANNEEVERYEAISEVTIPTFNFNFLGELNEKLSFQSELNFELNHGLRIELLRLYLDYRINPKFNLQVGKFLSPIGYLNRNQRFYGYLNNSVKARDMVFEEYSYIPLFTMGLQAYGTFEAGGGKSAINYFLAYGINRAEAPHGPQISSMNWGDDHAAASPGISGILEWTSYGEKFETSVGLSGYFNPQIKSFYVQNGADFVEDVDPAIELDLQETGFAPYVRVNSDKFQCMAEYHNITFEDKENVSGKSVYRYNAASFELMYKTKVAGKPFGPYVRYDFRKVDGSHPYYGLEDDDGVLHKNFVPEESEAVSGFVWDLFPSNRFKVEYGANFAGAAPKGRVSISTSFAF